MRDQSFHEELTVELTEDERNLRGRQAARTTIALEAHQARAKEAKKKLADEEKKLEEGLLEASRAAELGEEKRQVECVEKIDGVMVVTVRTDTQEVLGSRAATKQELAEHDEEHPPMVPGGGAKKSPNATH